MIAGKSASDSPLETTSMFISTMWESHETKPPGTPFIVADPVKAPWVALIMAAPPPVDVARPVLMMVAIIGLLELQATALVRFEVEPSL